MIEIINRPKKPVYKRLEGTCVDCRTRVRCDESDTKELIDRDTTPGSATRYIACPICRRDFLWVK